MPADEAETASRQAGSRAVELRPELAAQRNRYRSPDTIEAFLPARPAERFDLAVNSIDGRQHKLFGGFVSKVGGCGWQVGKKHRANNTGKHGGGTQSRDDAHVYTTEFMANRTFTLAQIDRAVKLAYAAIHKLLARCVSPATALWTKQREEAAPRLNYVKFPQKR